MARFAEQRAQDDFQWLMAAPQGRRLVWGWLSEAGVFRNPFGATDAQTAFACGRLAGGQRLLAQVMERTPEAFARMLKEHNENG
ncbi:MAG: hypothetical protein ACO27H_12535 [Burkholderiaceae bacterium]